MKIKQVFLSIFILFTVFVFTAQADNNPIILPAPQGNGQTWPNGTTQNIQWSVPSPNAASNSNISLVPYSTSSCTTINSNISCSGSAPYVIASNVPNNGNYSGNFSTDVNGLIIPSGQYLINVYDNNNNSLSATGTSSQIITIPNFTPSSNAPSNFWLNPNSGTAGSRVTLMGTGFASSTYSSIQFGNNSFLTANGTSTSGSLQFTVPGYSQPCSSASYPAGVTNSATTTTANGTCSVQGSPLAPGVYNVTVNSNGTSYMLPFTIIPAAASSTPGTGLQFPPYNYPDNSLIQINGNPTVYLVSNGKFSPFTSSAIFLGRGYQWSQVQTIDASQFNSQLISSLPVLAANGAIIKTATNPTIYLVSNGQKSAIPSMTVFNRLGLNLANLVVISDQDLQSYPSAPDQM